MSQRVGLPKSAIGRVDVVNAKKRETRFPPYDPYRWKYARHSLTPEQGPSSTRLFRSCVGPTLHHLQKKSEKTHIGLAFCSLQTYCRRARRLPPFQKNGEDCQKTRSKRRRKDARKEPAANRVLVRVLKLYLLSPTSELPKSDIGRVGIADRSTEGGTFPPRRPRVAHRDFFVEEIRAPLAK